MGPPSRRRSMVFVDIIRFHFHFSSQFRCLVRPRRLRLLHLPRDGRRVHELRKGPFCFLKKNHRHFHTSVFSGLFYLASVDYRVVPGFCFPALSCFLLDDCCFLIVLFGAVDSTRATWGALFFFATPASPFATR